MTAEQIARLLKARRYAKGKWMARCVAHRERTSSLSITDMGGGNTRVHCFAGCSQADVLSAAGLTWRDLRAGDVTQEIRERLTWQDKREALEKQLGLVIILGVVERGKRAYWAAAERRIRGDLDWLRCRLEPEQVIQEWRAKRFQQRFGKYGLDRLMEEAYANRAREGFEGTEAEVRTNSLRNAVRELLPRGVQDIGNGQNMAAGH